MMRPRNGLVVLTAALALAGCGSDEEGDPIPQDVAGAIESQLTSIQARVDAENEGACADIEKNDAEGTFAEIDRQVEAVPDNVDGETMDALRDSVDRLKELVRQRCGEIVEEAEAPDDTETITIETVPEETPTDTVETVPQADGDEDELPPGQLEQPEKPGKGPQDGGTEPGGGGTGGGAPAPGDE